MNKLVDLIGVHVEATTGAPLVLLREHDEPHRVVPIFIGASEATSIAVAVSGQPPPRPLTHDLMASLVDELDGRLESASVTDLHDGTFVAELVLRGPGGERRLDTRPSDAIALAVRMGAPLFVSEAVLDEAGTLLGEELDEESIDAAVDEFRSFLDTLDPTDFTEGDEGEPPSLPAGGRDADEEPPARENPPDVERGPMATDPDAVEAERDDVEREGDGDESGEGPTG